MKFFIFMVFALFGATFARPQNPFASIGGPATSLFAGAGGAFVGAAGGLLTNGPSGAINGAQQGLQHGVALGSAIGNTGQQNAGTGAIPSEIPGLGNLASLAGQGK